jgi:hypothetical protein
MNNKNFEWNTVSLSVPPWNGVKQWNTWNENGTEILKIIRDHSKVSKSGWKRSAEHESYRKRKCREDIMADRRSFLQEGFGEACSFGDL